MSTTSGTGAAGSGILDGKVPVFVFPVQLDFYYEDQTTHKRVVTIYNPYEFDVTFKVLCNNPKKYAVVEPEGKIFGQKCVDIVIRYLTEWLFKLWYLHFFIPGMLLCHPKPVRRRTSLECTCLRRETLR